MSEERQELSAMVRAVVVVSVALVMAACVHHLPADRPNAPAGFTRTLTLNGHPVTLHLNGAALADSPLLVYATGDGGWRGKDRDLYRHLVSWGYATAGFSAPQYVKHLKGDDQTTTPGQLARDYSVLINVAKDALLLPASMHVVLVGVSRGAGLSVVAAGQPALRPVLDGVLAVGLTKEEEHVRWFRRRASVELQIYDYLPRLGVLPLAVIQSTHDNYLPAAAARTLFGGDTDRRKFHAVEAKNHSFAGSRARLYDTVQASLAWITSLPSASRRAGSSR